MSHSLVFFSFLAAGRAIVFATQEVRRSTLPWQFWGILGAVIFLGLTPRIYGLEERSVWLDEDSVTAALGGKMLPGLSGVKDVVKIAAVSYQPPLSYYPLALALKLGGNKPWVVRMPSVFFGTLTVFMSFFFFFWFTQCSKKSFLGTAIFSLHPFMLFYSQEARPYACALFFGSIVLWRIFCWRPIQRVDGVLFGSALGLALSTNLQSLAFLSAILVGYFFTDRKILWSLLAAIVLALPFCLYAVFLSDSLDPTLFRKAPDFIRLGQWEAWRQIYLNSVLYQNWEFWLIMLGAFLAFVRGKTKSLVSLLLVFSLAGIFLVPIFLVIVDRPFHVRYGILLFLPLAWMTILTLLNSSQRLFLVILVVSLVAHLFYLPQIYGEEAPHPLRSRQMYNFRPPWKEIYAYLRAHSGPKDRVLLVHLQEPEKWVAPGFVASDFYYPPGGGAQINSMWGSSWSPVGWVKNADQPASRLWILFLSPRPWLPSLQPLNDFLNGLKPVPLQFSSFVLIEVLDRDWRPILKKIAILYPNPEGSLFVVYEILWADACIRKDISEQKFWRKRLETIGSKKKYFCD